MHQIPVGLDRVLLVHAISHLRLVQDRYAQAIADEELALRLYREVGHCHGEANALNNLGWLHARRGQRDQAIARTRQAIDLSVRLGYPFGDRPDLELAIKGCPMLTGRHGVRRT